MMKTIGEGYVIECTDSGGNTTYIKPAWGDYYKQLKTAEEDRADMDTLFNKELINNYHANYRVVPVKVIVVED